MHELVDGEFEQVMSLGSDGALDVAQGRITLLESKLQRAEEENSAFMQSLRHVAAAAEELMAESRAEADSMQATAQAEADSMRAAVQAEAEVMRSEVSRALEDSLSQAQREAEQLLSDARTQAFEMVAVARADARDALMSEHSRVSEEAEMLSAMRERIEAERQALSSMHSQLSGRLRTLVKAMLEFADRGAEIDLGDPQLLASAGLSAVSATPTAAPVLLSGPGLAQASLTGPRFGASAPDDDHDDDRQDVVPRVENSPPELPMSNRVTSASTMPLDGAMSPTDLHPDDEHLDRAFNAFFAADDDSAEPARRWILED